MTAVPMVRDPESDSGQDELLLAKSQGAKTYRSGERTWHLFPSREVARKHCAKGKEHTWIDIQEVPKHWQEI